MAVALPIIPPGRARAVPFAGTKHRPIIHESGDESSGENVGDTSLEAVLGQMDETLRAEQVRIVEDDIQHAVDMQFLRLYIRQRKTLRQLPAFICSARHVRELWVNYNSLLSTLPNTLGEMQNLIYLDLSENAITELPDEITNLVNLRKLGVRGNQLRTLPFRLTHLESLEELDLRDNPLHYLPYDIQYAKVRDLLIDSNEETFLRPSHIDFKPPLPESLFTCAQCGLGLPRVGVEAGHKVSNGVNDAFPYLAFMRFRHLDRAPFSYFVCSPGCLKDVHRMLIIRQATEAVEVDQQDEALEKGSLDGDYDIDYSESEDSNDEEGGGSAAGEEGNADAPEELVGQGP